MTISKDKAAEWVRSLEGVALLHPKANKGAVCVWASEAIECIEQQAARIAELEAGLQHDLRTARYGLDALVRSPGKRSSHAIGENQWGSHRPPHSTGAKIMTNEHAATLVPPGSDQRSASIRDCLAVLTDWAVSTVGPENVNLHPEVVQAMEALAVPAPAPLQLTEEEIASAYLLVARGLDDLNHYLSDNDPAKDGYSADEVQALVELQLAGPKIANIFEGASTRCDRHDEPAAPTP